MPTVSVQIVTFNSENEIGNCLNSVLKQSYPIEYIVVIDNESKDNTVNVVQRFKGIQLVKNVKNNGFAGGHNQALQLHASDYVLVLNPDVELHKNYILNIVQKMELKRNIGAATGKLYRMIDSLILDSTGLVIKKNRRAFDRGAGQKDLGQFDGERSIFGVSGAAAIYRRKMIDQISLEGEFFDETFFAYKEDVDVSWRAQIYGWNSIFVPEAIAEHGRGWGEERKRKDISMKIRRHSYINRYFYILKNDSLFYFLKSILCILIYECLSFGYALLKEPGLLKAWLSFFNEISTMFKKRREVQKHRNKPRAEIYKYFHGWW